MPTSRLHLPSPISDPPALPRALEPGEPDPLPAESALRQWSAESLAASRARREARDVDGSVRALGYVVILCCAAFCATFLAIILLG